MQCQLTVSIYGTRSHPFTQHLLQLQCHSQGCKASREGIESARICNHCIRGARGRLGKMTHNLQEKADLGFVGKAPNPPLCHSASASSVALCTQHAAVSTAACFFCHGCLRKQLLTWLVGFAWLCKASLGCAGCCVPSALQLKEATSRGNNWKSLPAVARKRIVPTVPPSAAQHA